ncbi:unnamed protein product [Mytilus coruscus]|uniref:Uncharacterized protein n=1 Tax=Mytilus coruscus TaxID=42192 RepID=A0A6J8BVC3_MYTCO|nr:unnamed protein product [Mytilus coruscus]
MISNKVSSKSNLMFEISKLKYAIPNKGLKTGLTPLSVAALKGHLDIVQYLLTVDCVRETRSEDGRTALHVASQYGHFHVTKWLIEEGGISPLVVTYKGITPYQLAAAKNGRDSFEKRKEKNKIMDFLKTVMSTEKYKVSSKIPQQKGLLQVPKGPKEEVPIFSDKEFKGLLISGAYKCFWNRIFLTGPFGVGKTSLAKILVGDEAPEERKSTDGIWIYLGRAGMDIKERCWIFLKHGTILNATVQSLLRTKTPSHIVTLDDRRTKMEDTKRDKNMTAIDMTEEEIIKLVRSQCHKGHYEMQKIYMKKYQIIQNSPDVRTNRIQQYILSIGSIPSSHIARLLMRMKSIRKLYVWQHTKI